MAKTRAKVELFTGEEPLLPEITEEAENETEEQEEEVVKPKKKSLFGEWSERTVSKKHIKMLLYGPSGAGKTRFAATFPKPLFLDLENGLRSTIKVKPVQRYPANPANVITELRQVQRFLKAVKEDESPEYETIVVDSLNELQMLITKDVVGKFDANRQYEDQLTYSDYGKMNRDFIDMIRDFLALPYHIIFTAIETPREYEEQQLYPKFVGKQVGPDLLRIMEMIGYCHVIRKGESAKHYVSFQMSPTYIAKDRMGIAEVDIPNDYDSLINSVKAVSTEEALTTERKISRKGAK